MEDTVNNPVFFEFFGLPGCGKSTVSHAVARLLREEGYTVEEPSFTIDHQRRIIRKIKKIAIAVGWFIVHYKVYIAIRDIVKKNGYNGTELLTQTVNVIQKIRKYNGKADARIYIWDQGLIQAAISLSIKGKISASENYRILLSHVHNSTTIFPILINIDERIALKRMSMRQSNDSRIEKLSTQKLKDEMLSSFQTSINSVKSAMPNGIVIDGRHDIKYITDNVYKTIVNVLKYNYSW